MLAVAVLESRVQSWGSKEQENENSWVFEEEGEREPPIISTKCSSLCC